MQVPVHAICSSMREATPFSPPNLGSFTPALSIHRPPTGQKQGTGLQATGLSSARGCFLVPPNLRIRLACLAPGLRCRHHARERWPAPRWLRFFTTAVASVLPRSLAVRRVVSLLCLAVPCCPVADQAGVRRVLGVVSLPPGYDRPNHLGPQILDGRVWSGSEDSRRHHVFLFVMRWPAGLGPRHIVVRTKTRTQVDMSLECVGIALGRQNTFRPFAGARR